MIKIRQNEKGHSVQSGPFRLFNEVGAKKQGCKNTAPKNFNHIFIEKPVTNFHNLEVTLISKLANAIIFLVNVRKTPLNDWAKSNSTASKWLSR